MHKTILFIGKGGVGKTTCAAHTALALADAGRRVLIASLDPAHNLGDVLEISLKDRPVKVSPRLDAMEIDVEARIRGYLRRAADRFESIYRYLRAFNLDRSVDLLRYAPGVEEEALLEALRELMVEEDDGHDVVVVDTAPTGLTLRVLGLPPISLLWLDRLIGVRLRILKLRGMVAHVKGDQVFEVEGERMVLPHEEADDPVLKELHAARAETMALHAMLADGRRTAVGVVMNPESLPLLETLRTLDALDRFGIPPSAVIVNKVFLYEGAEATGEDRFRLARQTETLERLHQAVRLPIFAAPLEPTEIRGLDRLRAFRCGAATHFATWVSEEGTR